MDNNIKSLAEAIVAGTATETDMGITLRTVQLALGSQFLDSIDKVTKSNNRLANLLSKATDKFVEKVNAMIDADTIDHSDLFEMIKELQNKQLQIAELQRKVVQSPNKIFPEDTLSPEEKKLLGLFQAFNTNEEKQRFLLAVKKAMEEQVADNSFDN